MVAGGTCGAVSKDRPTLRIARIPIQTLQSPFTSFQVGTLRAKLVASSVALFAAL